MFTLEDAVKNTKIATLVFLVIGIVLMIVGIVFNNINTSNDKANQETLKKQQEVQLQTQGDTSFTQSIIQDRKTDPVSNFFSQLPYTSPNGDFHVYYYSPTYTIAVKLYGTDKTKSQKEAQTWLNSFGMDFSKYNVQYFAQ